jgi:hypothetical protein
MFQAWATENGYKVDPTGVINNKKHMTFEAAKNKTETYLLRFRKRSCRICQVNFDITKEGFAYRCDVCRKFGSV